MMNILLLSAGRRVELAQAFAGEILERQIDAELLAADINPESSAVCQIVDAAIKSPRATDSNYVDFLVETCRRYKVGLVVPTIDTELIVLSKNRDAFEAEGIHLVVSDAAFVECCRDKRLTTKLFESLGIDAPKIYSRTELLFPCFVKPYDGSSGVDAKKINNEDELSPAMLRDERLMFMEWVDGSHQEFTVDAYYDRSGLLRCFVPRQRLEVRGGEVSKGVTRRNFVYEYLFPKLTALKGARGCITLQVFANTKTLRLAALEINPRFGGGYPLSFSAGARYPGWLIDEYLLGRQIDFYEKWESDLMMLRYDAKILIHDA